jgi:hypothetical protein
MRSRSIAVLSLAAASGLLLAGCASTPAAEPTTAAPTLATSSVEAPAATGERVGSNGVDLQVWSAVAPDEAAAATLGEPEKGSSWVTVTLAQWVSEDGQTDTDVAPVLRSSGDADFAGEAVSPRRVEVPMTADKSYTYAWSFQVPDDLVDPASLAVCTSAEADAACSQIAG